MDAILGAEPRVQRKRTKTLARIVPSFFAKITSVPVGVTIAR